MANSDHHIDTQLQHLGLSPEDNHGIPNPPIYRTSTILSSSMAQHRHEVPKPYDYGRIGTPTSAAFEQSVAALYEADDCISTPSGLSAISTALLSACDASTHLLVPDSLYGSARRFVEKTLSKLGVEITFYPPRLNAGITSLIQDNTSVIYIESPGSLTFELQDIRSIIEIARASNITTLCDNTWGTALHYPVLRYGIDIVIEAGTKYISGHSDTNLGIAAASGEHARNLRNTARNLGICAGPEDLYLGLRGLRTLRLRLEQSAANGLAVATAIKDHSLVNAMLHPAMADSPDNQIYQRDFSGPCGLFGVVIDGNIAQSAIDKAVEEMGIFRIGDSWGGYESLIKQAHLSSTMRHHATDLPDGHLLRLYTGLEHGSDLIADVQTMLDKLK